MALTGETKDENAQETKTEHAVHVWERWSTAPLAILAILYLVLYSYEVLGHLPPALFFDFVLISDIIWGVFIWARRQTQH